MLESSVVWVGMLRSAATKRQFKMGEKSGSDLNYSILKINNVYFLILSIEVCYTLNATMVLNLNK